MRTLTEQGVDVGKEVVAHEVPNRALLPHRPQHQLAQVHVLEARVLQLRSRA